MSLAEGFGSKSELQMQVRGLRAELDNAQDKVKELEALNKVLHLTNNNHVERRVRYRNELAAAQAALALAPKEAIGKCLADLMNVYAKNGANSVSMPDECVEVAYWLSYLPTNQDALHEALARECERLAEKVEAMMKGSAYLPATGVIYAINLEAAAHRARKEQK